VSDGKDIHTNTVTIKVLGLALELRVMDGNKIRQNQGNETIDVIYQQGFDVTATKVDFDQFPFSGPAKTWVIFTGRAKLLATIKTCPENSISDPLEVIAEWYICPSNDPSDSNPGVSVPRSDCDPRIAKRHSNWKAFANDFEVDMPDKVGQYTVNFTFTVDGIETKLSRKLLVTKDSPKTSTTPRRSWYEKATKWAAGKSDESEIIKSVLDGLYAFAGKKDSGGNTIWRYGYDFVPPHCKM